MTNVAVRKQTESQPENTPLLSRIENQVERRLEQVRQRAYDLFSRRGEEMDRALDDWIQAEQEVDGWCKAQLTEQEGSCEIRVTLPGFEPKEIEVTAMPKAILVEANTERRKEEKSGKDVVWSEFSASQVFREIALPQEANLNRVTASIDNGMLTINVPYVVRQDAKPLSKAAGQTTASAV